MGCKDSVFWEVEEGNLSKSRRPYRAHPIKIFECSFKFMFLFISLSLLSTSKKSSFSRKGT